MIILCISFLVYDLLVLYVLDFGLTKIFYEELLAVSGCQNVDVIKCKRL